MNGSMSGSASVKARINQAVAGACAHWCPQSALRHEALGVEEVESTHSSLASAGHICSAQAVSGAAVREVGPLTYTQRPPSPP